MSDTQNPQSENVDKKPAVGRKPGKGVLYFEPPERRRSEGAPTYIGFIVLEMDYSAGEKVKMAAWQIENKNGEPLISLSEDNYSKKRAQSESFNSQDTGSNSLRINETAVYSKAQAENEKVIEVSSGTTGKIKIQSGVGMPKLREIYDYPYPDMEVGDSFTVPIEARAKLLNANYRAGKKLGRKFVARSEGELIRPAR